MSNEHARPRHHVTLTEVATHLGVAPSTVSNAYNRPDQLSPALRERVLATAAQLGYPGPDPIARSLRRGKAGAVGVVYLDHLSYAFADPAFVLFLQGVAAALEEARLSMLLIPGSAREKQQPTAVSAAVIDSIIIYSMPDDDPSVSAALERCLPAVLVDGPRYEQTPFIGIDDEEAAQVAAKHLIDLGHRRIAVISLELSHSRRSGLADLSRQAASTYRNARSRLRGYTAAISAAGLPWTNVAVYECAENVVAEGQRAAASLLSRTPRPTALLAMSDRLAFGAIEAARQQGLSIPGDLSVVGFDDVPEAAQMTPALTTIHQPHFEKGVQTGRLLLAQLQGEMSNTMLFLPTKIVIRSSTAQPGTS